MKIIKFFAQLLLFILLPGIVLTVVASKSPVIENIQSFVVLSGSMEPTLPVGSLIYSQKADHLKVGDVISFKNGAGEVVTHRIVDILPSGYKTKGDANNTDDAAIVSKSQVLGREFFMLPFIGYLINFLKTPLGFSGLVIFPMTVFIVFEIWNFKTELEKHIEKKLMERMRVGSKI